MNAALEQLLPTDAEQHPPEGDLWMAALTLLLDDARAYWRGNRGLEFEQAFDDVLRVGPMLRWCCAHSGHNPQWIAEQYVKGLERMG